MRRTGRLWPVQNIENYMPGWTNFHKTISAASLIGNRYKLISTDEAEVFELYDLINDPSETTDLSAQHPEIVGRMKAELMAWRQSCQASLSGDDYQNP